MFWSVPVSSVHLIRGGRRECTLPARAAAGVRRLPGIKFTRRLARTVVVPPTNGGLAVVSAAGRLRFGWVVVVMRSWGCLAPPRVAPGRRRAAHAAGGSGCWFLSRQTSNEWESFGLAGGRSERMWCSKGHVWASSALLTDGRRCPPASAVGAGFSAVARRRRRLWRPTRAWPACRWGNGLALIPPVAHSSSATDHTPRFRDQRPALSLPARAPVFGPSSPVHHGGCSCRRGRHRRDGAGRVVVCDRLGRPRRRRRRAIDDRALQVLSLQVLWRPPWW